MSLSYLLGMRGLSGLVKEILLLCSLYHCEQLSWSAVSEEMLPLNLQLVTFESIRLPYGIRRIIDMTICIYSPSIACRRAPSRSIHRRSGCDEPRGSYISVDHICQHGQRLHQWCSVYWGCSLGCVWSKFDCMSPLLQGKSQMYSSAHSWHVFYVVHIAVWTNTACFTLSVFTVV